MKWRQEIANVTEQAAWYDQKFTAMGGVWQTPAGDWVDHMERMALQTGEHVADLGCGDGSFLRACYAVKGISGVGVDISDVAVRWAGRGRTLSFVHSDAGSWLRGQASDSWQRIVSLGSLEHFIDVEDVLTEVKRVLRPDGKWYFFVPNELWKHRDQPTERTGRDEEWVALFMRAGLKTTDKQRLGDCTSLWGGK